MWYNVWIAMVSIEGLPMGVPRLVPVHQVHPRRHQEGQATVD
jgi:hypothetical protein